MSGKVLSVTRATRRTESKSVAISIVASAFDSAGIRCSKEGSFSSRVRDVIVFVLDTKPMSDSLESAGDNASVICEPVESDLAASESVRARTRAEVSNSGLFDFHASVLIARR